MEGYVLVDNGRLTEKEARDTELARTRVGAGEISTGMAPRERRGGHACKIAKCKTGGIDFSVL